MNYSEQMVVYTTRYPAAIITLCSRATRNALSRKMIEQFMDGLHRAKDDPNVRAVIITGSDSSFCSGMDLKELEARLGAISFDGEGGAMWEDARLGEQLIDYLYRFPKPTIAAVNGDAVGGGAGLVSVCDMAVAASQARFGYPEMKRGIQAGMMLIHLMRIVGERQARFLILTGALVTAAAADEMGLINAVVPREQLMDVAMTWVMAVAANAPKAEAITKRLLEKFSSQATSMRTAEYRQAPHLTDECGAGLKAFFAKEPAPWDRTA